MRNEILDGTLTPKHREVGLRLVEIDDHFLELRNRQGDVIATFSQSGATVIAIKEEADKYLLEIERKGATT